MIKEKFDKLEKFCMCVIIFFFIYNYKMYDY